MRNKKLAVAIRGYVDFPGDVLNGAPVEFVGWRDGYPWCRMRADWPADARKRGDKFVWALRHITSKGGDE